MIRKISRADRKCFGCVLSAEKLLVYYYSISSCEAVVPDAPLHLSAGSRSATAHSVRFRTLDVLRSMAGNVLTSGGRPDVSKERTLAFLITDGAHLLEDIQRIDKVLIFTRRQIEPC